MTARTAARRRRRPTRRGHLSRPTLTRALAAAATVLALTGCGAPAPSSPEPSRAPAVARPEGHWIPPAHEWGPDQAAVAAGRRTAAAMTTEEAAGQVIVGRLHGTDPASAAGLVAELHLAGVMVTGGSVAGLEQVRELSAGVHEAVAADGRDWPGLVSTDNEGGTVQRMSGRVGPWTTFPPFSAVGEVTDTDLVHEAYAAMATELRASGVTVNWAPVADVGAPDGESAIGSRAAGADAETVARTAVSAMEGLASGGVLSAAKHFPGLGALAEDSHLTLPVLDSTEDELNRNELRPFAAAVAAGVPMIMVGHVDVPAWEPGVPASISPAAYRVLREELGFHGVAVTDSLGMGAIDVRGDAGEIAVAALQAGADLLLSPADNHLAHRGVVTAVEEGRLDRERLDEAAGRVIAMMRFQEDLAAAAGPVTAGDVGSASDEAQRLRDAAG